MLLGRDMSLQGMLLVHNHVLADHVSASEFIFGCLLKSKKEHFMWIPHLFVRPSDGDISANNS